MRFSKYAIIKSVFESLLKRASAVIALDGFMSDLTLGVVAALRPNDATLFYHKGIETDAAAAAPSPKTMFVLFDADTVRAKFVEAPLEADKRLWMACDTRAQVDSLHAHLKGAVSTKEGRAYTSKTPPSIRETEWRNCEEHWTRFDYVVSSPVIGTGVNFNPAEPHFHQAVGFFTGTSVEPTDAVQSLHRARVLIDATAVVCLPTLRRGRRDDPRRFAGDVLHANSVAELGFFYHNGVPFDAEYDEDGQLMQTAPLDWYRTACLECDREVFERDTAFSLWFLAMAARQGWRTLLQRPRFSSAAEQTVQRAERATHRAAERERAKTAHAKTLRAIADVSLVSDDEARRMLKNRSDWTLEDCGRMTKFFLYRRLGLSRDVVLTPDFLNDFLPTNQVSDSMTFFLDLVKNLAVFASEILYDDAAAVDESRRVPNVVRNFVRPRLERRQLLQRLLKIVGLESVFDKTPRTVLSSKKYAASCDLVTDAADRAWLVRPSTAAVVLRVFKTRAKLPTKGEPCSLNTVWNVVKSILEKSYRVEVMNVRSQHRIADGVRVRRNVYSLQPSRMLETLLAWRRANPHGSFNATNVVAEFLVTPIDFQYNKYFRWRDGEDDGTMTAGEIMNLSAAADGAEAASSMLW
jgi:hypothetical protein